MGKEKLINTKEMNVLDEVMKECEQDFEYLDEKIASNIYYISLSHALRSLEGMEEHEKEQKRKNNSWLEEETRKIHDIFVLNFDGIVRKLANGKKSCDGFFYNFSSTEDRQHYLVELKNVDKQTMLKMLSDYGENGIYEKVKDSVQLIKSQLLFGGETEKEAIIDHTHFFLVYGGKNNVPSRNPIKMVGKAKVSRGQNHKQNHAGRMNIDSTKQEDELYKEFGDKIADLKLVACSEDSFPGEALPRTRKVKGVGKIRQFSLFSSLDFARIIDAQYFDTWNWGQYQVVVSN